MIPQVNQDTHFTNIESEYLSVNPTKRRKESIRSRINVEKLKITKSDRSNSKELHQNFKYELILG
jgi:hypothetical protein